MPRNPMIIFGVAEREINTFLRWFTTLFYLLKWPSLCITHSSTIWNSASSQQSIIIQRNGGHRYLTHIILCLGHSDGTISLFIAELGVWIKRVKGLVHLQTVVCEVFTLAHSN